jgi:hypothetical protein
MTITRASLDQLARQWRSQNTSRDVLFALTGAIVLTALVLLWPVIPWALPFVGFMVILGVRLTLSRSWDLNAALLARHLDRAYPTLEESSALWLRSPENLTVHERLQLRRLDAAVAGLTPQTGPASFGAPPARRLQTARWCYYGSIPLLLLAGWIAVQPERALVTRGKVVARPARLATTASAPATPERPKIAAAGLSIVPPVYTGRPARQVDGLNAEVEQGAEVTWRLALDRPVLDARLVFGEAGADALPLHPVTGTSNRFDGSRVVNDAGLYHLAATLPDGTAWSPPELYSLKILRDRPPAVRILQPELPRTVLDSPGAPFIVESLAADDYGLVDAHLVATVAKGAGEAVKFREQTIRFDTDEPAAPGPGVPAGARRLLKTLDLAALGLEPGDELYFYVEARDNRQPSANITRSETRFVTIKGPTETPAAGGLGVAGVNLVPQYFRSERQLIIDTEKLIADRDTLPAEEFRRRSNDLGVDQQLLRLRYGQFVGEDFEQGAVTDHTEIQLNPLQAAPVQRTGPHAAASVAMRFLQEHAEQDRDGVDPNHETGLHAAPDHPLSANQVRAPYVDEHDSQDKATFFDHQTKGTLHDALGDMWQVEGFLRTSRPQDALAPEHHALDILKDLQQSARAYVQHVGFEPPPLKIAERRLQGDATSVPARAAEPPEATPNAAANSLEDVRAALAAVPWSRPSFALDAAQIETLRRIETALTAAATAKPETFLDGLRALRRVLAGNDSRPEEDFGSLEQALFRLLPPPNSLPDRAIDPAPSLSRSYFEALSQTSSAGWGVP